MRITSIIHQIHSRPALLRASSRRASHAYKVSSRCRSWAPCTTSSTPNHHSACRQITWHTGTSRSRSTTGGHGLRPRASGRSTVADGVAAFVGQWSLSVQSAWNTTTGRSFYRTKDLETRERPKRERKCAHAHSRKIFTRFHIRRNFKYFKSRCCVLALLRASQLRIRRRTPRTHKGTIARYQSVILDKRRLRPRPQSADDVALPHFSCTRSVSKLDEPGMGKYKRV